MVNLYIFFKVNVRIPLLIKNISPAELILNSNNFNNPSSVLSNCHVVIEGNNFPETSCKWVNPRRGLQKFVLSKTNKGMINLKSYNPKKFSTGSTTNNVIVSVNSTVYDCIHFTEYKKAVFKVGSKSLVQFIGTEATAFCECAQLKKEREEMLKVVEQNMKVSSHKLYYMYHTLFPQF